MNEKCYLCGKNADKYPKEKYLMGICNNCIVKIKNSAKKSQQENSINQSLNEIKKKIQQIQDRIENIIAIYGSSTPMPYTNPTNEKSKNAISSNKNQIYSISTAEKPKYSISTAEKSKKTSIKFRGEIRPINETEKRRKDQFQCPYCQLSIDPKLYFYPLVIHSCGNGYYHQKCFAKLMSEGKYHCLNCKEILFEKI